MIVLSVVQLGTGTDVRSSPKAMAKLKKEVRKTKEVLSANTEAPISVEALYDDRDFRSAPRPFVLALLGQGCRGCSIGRLQEFNGAVWEAT